MNEAAFQTQIIDLGHLLQWRVAHFRPARTAGGQWRTPVQADGAGFPDLVLVRERLVAVELKAERGKPTDAQQDWLEALRRAGVETYVWRPSDFDTAQRILTERHTPGGSLHEALQALWFYAAPSSWRGTRDRRHNVTGHPPAHIDQGEQARELLERAAPRCCDRAMKPMSAGFTCLVCGRDVAALREAA